MKRKFTKNKILPNSKLGTLIPNSNIKSKVLPNSKLGAMEMSVGTIVTIVLLMSVLVLGIFLVQQIFRTGTSAIDQVGTQIESEITKIFAEEGKSLVIYPTSQEITIRRGDSPKGFAFSVQNQVGAEIQTYSYKVEAPSIPSQCGGLTVEQANGFLLGEEGSFSLGGGNALNNARLVRFDVPETAPACSLFYELTVIGDLGQIENAQVFVTFR